MTEREFREFFKANWRGHLFFAKKMLPNDLMAAEDATQVAYLEAWETIKSGKLNYILSCRGNVGAISNYIYKQIARTALDYIKHLKRGKVVKSQLLYMSSDTIEAAEIKSDLLNRYCSELSSQQRKALQLYVDGYNYTDMAIALNININTCYTYVKRGLDKMRSKIGYTKPPRIGANRSKCLSEWEVEINPGKRINPYAI